VHAPPRTCYKRAVATFPACLPLASHEPDRRASRIRKSLLAVLLVAAVAGVVAWFVVAPWRLTRAPADAEPYFAIEVVAANAAASAPADGPRVVAAVSAASGPQEDPASCGEDQLPQSGELALDGQGQVAPVQTRQAGVGFAGAQHRLDALLRASADPFSRALADWLNLGGTFASPESRAQALVQDALATDDARTYGLAYRVCTQSTGQDGSCARLSAREWARRDAGNGLPWLFELARADHAGDAAAQAVAMNGLAGATRFDVHEYAAAAMVARLQIASQADLAAQHLAASLALAALPMPDYEVLTKKHCPDGAADDAQRRSACERIAQTMFDKSDGFVPRGIGGAIHKHLTADASWLERARQDVRAMKAQVDAGTVTTPCAGERQALARMVQFDTVNQVARIVQARQAPATAR